MEKHVLKCPNCDAALEDENGIDVFFCKHCGHRIMLTGVKIESIKARSILKVMEQVHKFNDKRYEFKRYKFEKKEQNKELEFNRNFKGGVISIALFLLLIFMLFGVSYNSEKKSIKEEQQLQDVVGQIIIDMEKRNYDEAYIKANSLYYTSNHSSEIEKKWNNTRKALLKKIKKEEKENSDKNSIFNLFK